jgi:hypothetical protein
VNAKGAFSLNTGDQQTYACHIHFTISDRAVLAVKDFLYAGVCQRLIILRRIDAHTDGAVFRLSSKYKGIACPQDLKIRIGAKCLFTLMKIYEVYRKSS